MISKMTAYEIFRCWSEIENTRKLKEDLEGMTRSGGRGPQYPLDTWGVVQTNFEFGVPNGENGHRLFRVSKTLAPAILAAHEGEMHAKLVALCEAAGLELSGAVAVDSETGCVAET